MKDLIVSKIESLPPLPSTLVKLQDACSKEGVSIKEIANIIEEDPFLMANIIKFANSPLYGASRQVTTILQATTMFGVKTIKGLAIASAIKAQFPIDLALYGIKTEDFVNASNLKSNFILEWYNQKKEFLDILVPLSFLMHIGMVLIARVLKEFQIVDLQGLDFEELKAIEKQAVGFNHIEILGILFEHWGFEKTMLEVIDELNNDKNSELTRNYTLPLKALNILIAPYKSATQSQIKNAREFVFANNLDLETFDCTLLKTNLVASLDELEKIG